MDISVIICTRNPRPDFLKRTLSALSSQTLPSKHWELLLVDNASSESLAEKWNLSWHHAGRHCREDELGLTAARLRGIKESKGDLLVFVDDDNLLAPDYLGNARALMEISRLGAFGAARIIPEYEEQPRPELLRYCGMLALRNRPDDQWTMSQTVVSDVVPFGAGLCVKRSVAEKLVQKKEKGGPLLDRKGNSLASSGDLEFSLAATDIGFGYGIFSRLTLTHLISASRVQLSYLLRLAEGMAFSNDLLGRLRNQELGLRQQPRFPRLRLIAGAPYRILSARTFVDMQFAVRSRQGRWRSLREFSRIIGSG